MTGVNDRPLPRGRQFTTPPPAFWFHQLHAQNVAGVGRIWKKYLSLSWSRLDLKSRATESFHRGDEADERVLAPLVLTTTLISAAVGFTLC
jgi:hypothetical protein